MRSVPLQPVVNTCAVAVAEDGATIPVDVKYFGYPDLKLIDFWQDQDVKVLYSRASGYSAVSPVRRLEAQVHVNNSVHVQSIQTMGQTKNIK